MEKLAIYLDKETIESIDDVIVKNIIVNYKRVRECVEASMKDEEEED